MYYMKEEYMVKKRKGKRRKYKTNKQKTKGQETGGMFFQYFVMTDYLCGEIIIHCLWLSFLKLLNLYSNMYTSV